MAKTPLPSAAEIAEKQMPGWKAVEPAGPVREFGATRAARRGYADVPDGAAPKVDAVMPDTDQLLRKYLGADAVVDAAAPADAVNKDIELVDLKSGDLERTVGVNRKSQKIEWSQG
jgi:hypothetical protein